MARLDSLLSEYNSGAHDIDQLFEDLVELAKDLSEEEQRAIKENLTEEELAIFDLLLKNDLNPDETEKVRKTARELLSKLKAEKLVLDWREKEQTRSGVKTTIFDLCMTHYQNQSILRKNAITKVQKFITLFMSII